MNRVLISMIGACVVALIMVLGLSDCGLFGSTKFPQDVLALYTCVQTEVEAGVTTVGTIAAACMIQEEQLVADAIAALLASKSWVHAHPDKVGPLTETLRSIRAKAVKP
jgi:hypothetical protein